MRAVLGIDRKIKRAWLDALLDHLTQTTDHEELRRFLDERLAEELPGHSSRAKSVGIALKIWSGIPANRVPLRDRAIALLPTISGQERVWLHWGMTSLAYPFFRDAAEVVGRLLTLQDDFTTAQVQERLLKKWGDRATTKEAAQKLLHTLVDWEVMRSTKTKGHFLLVARMSSPSSALQLWLLESLLAASSAEDVEAQQLLRLPETFPFQLSIGLSDLRRHDGFHLHRQGLDMDMVSVRVQKPSQPRKPLKTARKKPKPAVQAPTLFENGAEKAPKEPGSATAAAFEQVVISELAEPTISKHEVAFPVETLGVEPITDQVREPEAVPPLGEPDQIEERIKNEVLSTLGERAARARRIQEMSLVPYGPFAGPSSECLTLFRDGRFYGCIALTQAVIEALVRHVWQTKMKMKRTKAGSDESNLKSLCSLGVINTDLKTRLDLLWIERNDFHHLNPGIETDRNKLEAIALKNLQMLGDLERMFFGYSVNEGMLVPEHPEYWPVEEPGKVLVFMRAGS